jgi:hypothetical protein
MKVKLNEKLPVRIEVLIRPDDEIDVSEDLAGRLEKAHPNIVRVADSKSTKSTSSKSTKTKSKGNK